MKILLKFVFIIIMVTTIWMALFGIISSQVLEPILFPEKRVDSRLESDIHFKHGNYINYESFIESELGKTSESELLLNTQNKPFAKLTFLTRLPKIINGNIVNIERIYLFLDIVNIDETKNITLDKSIAFFVANNSIVDYTIIFRKIKNYKSHNIIYSNKILEENGRIAYWSNFHVDISCYFAQLPDRSIGVGKNKGKECPYSQFYIENEINLDSWDRKFYNGFIYVIIYPLFRLFL